VLLLIGLTASLSGSCLLTGCANQSWFGRFYKPAPVSYGSSNHLEKAYAPSEAMPEVPICGPIQEAFRFENESFSDSDLLATSGAHTVSSRRLVFDARDTTGQPQEDWRFGAPATPQLVWSSDPDGDGKRLAQEGYVLIGTSSFLPLGRFFSHSRLGLTQAVEESTAQGKGRSSGCAAEGPIHHRLRCRGRERVESAGTA